MEGIMFKVYINDGSSNLPKDDICYIIGKNGIFLKKNMGIVNSVTKVDKISILKDVEPFAKINVEKIPRRQFAKVLKFFRDIYKLYHTECGILMYYNMNTKKYLFKVPEQTVSIASLEYKNQETPPNYILLGTIHSHGSMCASHSGVDDSDEKDFDGLHITLGDVDNVNENNFSISCSIVINGQRFLLEPEDYIDSIRLDRTSLSEQKEINGTFGIRHVYYHSRLTKKYFIKATENESKYPFEWLTKVVNHNISTFDKSNYDFDYWGDYGDYNIQRKIVSNLAHRSGNKSKSKSVHHVVSIAHSIRPQISQDYNPCEHCVFKNYKLKSKELNDDYIESNWEPTDEYFTMGDI
jgi:hypothetical protein